jgi:DMSO reductase anchor subunit
MHPAFSVILFTTLSGAGYGLLFWSALAALAPRAPAGALAFSIAVALALATLGLLSSLAHLGKPQRAWRAFSQWRSSWLSREGVAAVLTYVPALALLAQLWPGGIGLDAPWAPALWIASALLAALGAVATVACTAMIYASLVPIPAWRHRLVLPVYLLFALLTGGLLLGALAPSALAPLEGLAPVGLIVLAVALSIAKWRYWRDIDRAPGLPTLAAAVGLPRRSVGMFERPHTEANYLTREMGFVLARRHARRLRMIAFALFGVLAGLCLLPAWLLVHLDAGPWYAAAGASALLGALVERWLFFAQARHVVAVYYGIEPGA